MNMFSFYWLFFKIGLFNYGGGYAMVPLFYDELVRHYRLISAADFGNLIAVAQMTPGPVGINAATYIGYTHNGIVGALVGTAGVVTPSVIIITIIVHCLARFQNSITVKGLLFGIRPVTVGLIAAAVLFFAEMSVFTGSIPFERLLEPFIRTSSATATAASSSFGISWQGAVIFAGSWLAIARFKISMFVVIIAAAAAGILLFQ